VIDMKFQRYEDWRDEKQKWIAQLKKVPCKECDGEGSSTCSCCGVFSECMECDGVGEKVAETVNTSLARREYIKCLAAHIGEMCALAPNSHDYLDILSDLHRQAKTAPKGIPEVFTL
jgi:RecJ-like exonuclease